MSIILTSLSNYNNIINKFNKFTFKIIDILNNKAIIVCQFKKQFENQILKQEKTMETLKRVIRKNPFWCTSSLTAGIIMSFLKNEPNPIIVSLFMLSICFGGIAWLAKPRNRRK